MKKPILMILCSLFMTSALARVITLRQNTPIYEITRRGDIDEKGTFLAGTEVEIFRGRDKVPGLGRVVLVRSVLNPHYIDSNYRHNLALTINRNSDYIDYLIKESDLEGRGNVRRNPRRVPTRRNPRRDVVVRDYNEYEVCYETPRGRVVEINEKQRKRGTRNVVGGIIGAIGGQIIGGNVGDIVSAIGIGFTAVGAAQVASSEEVFYTDYDISCRNYYTADTHVYNFRRDRQYCSTTRYYSNRWDNTVEYFETECFSKRNRRGHSSRFVTFESSYEIYHY